METTQHPVLKDPSELSNDDLATSLIQSYRGAGLEFVHPVLFPVSEVEETLQARIQRVQDVPALSPEVIAEKYSSAVNERWRYASNPSEDLDKIINRRGQSAVREGFLKEMGLSRIEQILLLRGVVLATNARYREAAVTPSKQFSERQREIQRTAVSAIHHFATNPVHVCPEVTKDSLTKFLNTYSASYIAKLIEREVFATDPPSQYDERSVVRAMAIAIPFGRLLSRQYDVTQSIFALGGNPRDRGVEPTEFHPKHITEIDRNRIVELMKLRGILGETFTSYNFYDTVRPFIPITAKPKGRPESDDTETDGKPKKPRVTRENHDGEKTEEDYVVLEIATREENGHQKIHVVADNAQLNNACYALRQEVLDEWQRLTGIRFNWQDIFSQRKDIVRQLGAETFHHNKGSNVPERVRDYLTQDEETVVTLAFGKLFDRNEDPKKQLFDDAMNPTGFNKMPPVLVQEIQKSVVLKAFWPMIREFGYAQTHRTILALVRGQTYEAPKRVVAATRKPAVVAERSHAADLWERIIEEELASRYNAK